MADGPDLIGKVMGLVESLPGEPCFDAAQPWFVKIVIQNVGTAPAGTFGALLETFEKGKGPGLDLKPFQYATMTFKMPASMDFKLPPPMMSIADWRLPYGIAHTDFGKKFPFLLSIVDPNKTSGESAEAQKNNFVFVSETPPILESIKNQPPAPPSPWDLSASAKIGEQHTVITTIRNQTKKSTPAATLELVLRVPKPGAPTGTPEVVGLGQIPALKAGAQAEVTINSKQAFILPVAPKTKPAGSAKKVDPKAKKTSGLGRTTGGAGIGKAGGGLGGGLRTLNFKALIPFSLRIAGSGTEIGFGGVPTPAATGKLKIPQK